MRLELLLKCFWSVVYRRKCGILIGENNLNGKKIIYYGIVLNKIFVGRKYE